MEEKNQRPPIRLDYRSDPGGVEGRARRAHRSALYAMAGGFASAGLAMAGGLLERPLAAMGMLCFIAGCMGGIACYQGFTTLRLKSEEATDRHLAVFGAGLGLLSIFAAVRFLWPLLK